MVTMLPHLVRVLPVLVLLGPAAALRQESAPEWPQWRGPLGTGFAPDARPPLEWSETKNVRWKTVLPGRGHSTPVVSGDLLVVTSAVASGDPLEPRWDDAPGTHDSLPVTYAHEFVALGIRRTDGEVLWQRTLATSLPNEGGHDTGSYASASPVTDGERVFVSFGSHGVHALGLDGVVRWQVDLGDMRTKHAHGEGSSPALLGDTLVVNWDHEGDSFVVALDKRTGEERWRKARDEPTSWSSPLAFVHDGRAQVVVSATGRVRSYDLASGEPVWECGGLSHNVVATPVTDGKMLWAGSSYEKQAMLAIRMDGAHGDISNSEHIAWYRRKSTPYVPSPLLMDGWLYFLNHYQGFLVRAEGATGREQSRPRRLSGIDDVYASPIGVAGRIYLVDRSGVTVVLEPAAGTRELARNVLEDSFSASPVAVGRELFLRGERALYCLAEAD